MSNSIKALTRTAGWKAVEEMFDKEIEASLNPTDIDPKLGDTEYAREVRARVIASAHLKSFLNKIKLAGVKITQKEKPTYK